MIAGQEDPTEQVEGTEGGDEQLAREFCLEGFGTEFLLFGFSEQSVWYLWPRESYGSSDCSFMKTFVFCQAWWCAPLIPVLGRQRQAELLKFEASLV